MLPIHNAFWAGVVDVCGPQMRAAGIEKFQAVAVISADGTVTEYLPDSSAPPLRCFSKQMVGRKYPAPPQAPFYERYTVSLGGS
ncbi:hypothetical protein [Cognatilysobacter lacus]|uniref:Uncharacterized protein n=1 Tax=Cognatilysobacter lacus TaxID=1643323 RepID=A0A5D8Z510_9GAMM|nr:hypothetical protein [Lysobacter lacus]TZF87784.1 hypothetical protein FW784_10695 [Lysobacter lacus]